MSSSIKQFKVKFVSKILTGKTIQIILVVKPPVLDMWLNCLVVAINVINIYET